MSTGQPAKPPRIARLLVSALLGSPEAELVREIDEEHSALAASRGRWVAALWYWRQVLRPDTLRLRRELRALSQRNLPRRGRSAPWHATALGMLSDVRFAWRTFLRQPGFAATVVITLALGIGGNTAIFSVVRGVLLKPLPYPEAERLVYVWVQTEDSPRVLFSGPGAADFVAQAKGFSGVTRIFGAGRTTVDWGDGVEEALAVGVAPDAFTVYGVTPVVGRNFRPEDLHQLSSEQMRDPDLVRPLGALVLGHGYWMNRFGGDSSIVGRIVQRGGHAAAVLGVQPPGFDMHLPAALGGATGADLWYLPYWDQSLFPRGDSFVRVVARLAPGVTLSQAQAEADDFARRQRELYPVQRNRNYRLHVTPLREGVVADSARPVLTLFGAVAFVLLIACANVANLLLAQAMAREREWIVRASLGAGWGRLLRQSLTESALLAAAGAAVGIAIAWWGVPALLAMSPDALPRVSEIGIDSSILAFTVSVAVFATLAFGLAPALRTAACEPADVVRGRGAVTRRRHSRFRRSLVVGEVALALVLVVGTGLLLRSFVGLLQVDPGFDADGVITASVAPTSQNYPTPESRMALFREIHDRFSALPGVSAVGIAQPLPFHGIQVASVGVRQGDGDVVEYRTGLRQWFPGTFETLGMHLLAGRSFDWSDFTDVNRFSVVVDDRFARTVWPGEDPLGKRVRVARREYGAGDEIWFERYWAEVVGVVRGIRGSSLDREDPPSIFLAFHVNPWAPGAFAVRAAGDPAGVVAGMRAALREVTTAYPLSEVSLLATDVERSLDPARFSLNVVGLFGLVSLIMAFVGIYGVLAYDVRQRSAELGTRLALGATTGDILRLIVGDGIRMMFVGLALGGIAALAVTRVLESQLVGISATDPLTFGAVVLLLFGGGVAACYLPARRASRLNPMDTLGVE